LGKNLSIRNLEGWTPGGGGEHTRGRTELIGVNEKKVLQAKEEIRNRRKRKKKKGGNE